MSELLLATKLTIPPIRQNLVDRQRLIDQLNHGCECPLTLISSPPGFGKTTLLCAWAQQAKVPIGWLTLDQEDNDTIRFIQYVYAAIQTIESGLPDLQIEGLRSHYQAITTLIPLINYLNQIPSHFALVLDDYQLISLPTIHTVVTYLLEHIPSMMHLIIASRADPPLPLARFRARGQMLEIRAADLRFSRNETDEFISDIMGLDLRPTDVTALESRTEGWITGLQLAALSMRNKQDLPTFVAGFTGSHEYIVDYLTDEVLRQQSDNVRLFLLKTSILNRMTGSLCDWITGGSSSQQMLEFLDRTNLFVTPLDTQRQWYRYHQLFADLLRQRLLQAYPDTIYELHAKASEWYAARGLYSEAIDHALDGKSYDRAAAILDQIAESMLMRSEVTTLLNWIQQLPEDYLNDQPSLALFYAWAAVMDGYALDKIEKRLESVPDLETAKADSYRAFVSLSHGKLNEAQQLAQQALTHFRESDQFLRSATTWILDFIRIMTSDLRSSREQLEVIADMTQTAGNAMMTMMTMCNVAEMTMRQGQLHQAHTLYERILSLAVDDSGQPLPISGMAFLGLAELAREWGDFDAAKRYVEKGILPAAAFSSGSNIEAQIHLARIYQSMGDYRTSQTAFEKAAALAAEYETSDIDDQFVELMAARLWILQGKYDAVEQWITRLGLATMDSTLITNYYDYHIFHHEYLTVARLRLAQGQPAQALSILEELLNLLEIWGWLQSRREIELHVVRAITFYALRRKEQALSALISALELAEPGGYVRTFVDEGPPMAELLELALTKGIMPVYTTRLLEVFSKENHIKSNIIQDLHDPLSERELEVLRLIAAGLPNPAIANRLVVAVGTIKAHTSSIYSKLGVNNRIQAVHRARELNLL
jgi:LuxR family maltose regulon positive regulatory protein